MALLLLQSISGITLAFPQTARALAGVETGQRAGRPRADIQPVDPTRLIITGIAAARAALPDAVLEDLRLPGAPGRPMSAALLRAGEWQGSPPAFVMTDPATARVTSVQDPRNSPPGAALLDWLRVLHEGAAFGPAWRGLMTLFALTLPLFPVTGVAMWLLRRRIRRRLPRPRVAAQAGD